jgi:hypothetical protein
MIDLTWKKAAHFSVLVAIVANCSGDDKVNIGNVEKRGGKLSDYVATWSGHAQAYTFGDGSDHVQLTVDDTGHGALRFGEAPAPAPATDPHVGYPQPYDPMNVGGVAFGVPGFPYPIYAAQVQSSRLQLGADIADIYAGWCALQTPRPNPTNSDPMLTYACGPEISGSVNRIEYPRDVATDDRCVVHTTDGNSLTASCGWLSLCWITPTCTCTATVCSAMSQVSDPARLNQYPVQLDGELDASGDTFTGTLVLQGTRITVILKRQA